MRITIIKEDNFVSIDGVLKEMNLSFLPDDFHALQFNGNKGFVESSDIDKCTNLSAIADWSSWTEFDSKLKVAKDKINPVDIAKVEPEPEPETNFSDEEVMSIFRENRNFLLQESDIYVLRKIELGQQVNQELIEYRQALRDLPQKVESGSIQKPIFQDNDIVFNNWPVKPF